MLSCQRLPSLSGLVQSDTARALALLPQPLHQPLSPLVQGRDRAGTEATSSTFPSLPLHGQVCPELNLPF